MAGTWIDLPPSGGGGSDFWGDAVANVAALPLTGITGEIRQTLDTEDLYRWNGVAWVLYLNPTVSGDVFGPASATADAVARFNGTTGKLIKNSAVTISDAGVISGNGSGLTNLPAGGVSGQVQYNNAGVFGGAAGFTYAGTVVNVQIQSVAATDIAFVVKGSAAQTANLQQWRDSTNSVLASINKDGSILYNATTTPTFMDAVTVTGFGGFWTGTAQTTAPTAANFTLLSSGGITALNAVPGGVTQLRSGGVTSLVVSDALTAFVPRVIVNYNAVGTDGDVLASFSSLAFNATYKPIVARGYPGQSANLQEWQNSSGTVLALIAPTGKMAVNAATITTDASLEVGGTNGAFLLPRLTTTQRDALTGVNGMSIYNTTTDRFQGYAAGAWVDLHGWGA